MGILQRDTAVHELNSKGLTFKWLVQGCPGILAARWESSHIGYTDFYLNEDHRFWYKQTSYFLTDLWDDVRQALKKYLLLNCGFRLGRKKDIFQMRLGSRFKMRISILNPATTEQMEYILFFFFRLHQIYKIYKINSP